MQDLSEAADLGSGVGEVVGQVEAVVLLGFLGFLAGCFEELAELCQQAVGGFKDLMQKGSGIRVRLGCVEPVGQIAQRVAVDVGGAAVWCAGGVPGRGHGRRLGRVHVGAFVGQNGAR